MKSIKTANILLIGLLVLVAFTVVYQIFGKEELPSVDGTSKVALQKSLFGLNLNKAA